MQKLPIGIQHFAHLRERNYLYIDKTRQIFDLINAGEYIFLSRPRRFGKSLLTTTLQEIYRGNQALFKGLWIEDKIDWQPHPVILINFNALNYLDMPLAQALAKHMDELAAQNKLTLTETDYKGKFRELISRLAEHGKVVLLVDEYDKAITDLLENDEKVQEHVATLKNFYSVLKAPEAANLEFTLLTGVSKYGKVSVFSDLNNLLDVTMDPRFATLLGYTQEELERDFSGYIDRLATTYRMNHTDMLERIRFWYNGYSWDGVNRVYVPFSTLVFLEQQRFANHWFSTATPSFLIKLLRKKQIPAYEIEQIRGGTALLDSADVNNISVQSLLFQTGYLTVKALRTTFSGETQYQLGYPNFEVAHAFQQYLLADYLGSSVGGLAGTLLARLEESLQTENVAGFVATLQSIFASIPHQLFLPQEAYYHSVIYLVLKLLGFNILAELMTNLGRIDAVLELPNAVYILEFKMTTAETAIQQIRDKQYAQPFRTSDKPIILLGIAFDKDSRNISIGQPSGSDTNNGPVLGSSSVPLSSHHRVKRATHLQSRARQSRSRLR